MDQNLDIILKEREGGISNAVRSDIVPGGGMETSLLDFSARFFLVSRRAVPTVEFTFYEIGKGL